MLQTKAVENIKTHILCSVTFFEYRAVYEIMWKNIVERGRRQMTIWRVRIACWVTKGIHTHTHTHTLSLSLWRICNTNCCATTMVARTHARYTYSTLRVLAVAMLRCDRPVDVTFCCLPCLERELLAVSVVLWHADWSGISVSLLVP